MKSGLKEFIRWAKVQGYADTSSVWKKTEEGGKTISINKGDYVYTDTYFGSLVDCGQEKISFKGKVVWVMAYRGGALNERLSKKAFSFLKKCISMIPEDFPSRGPKEFSEGKWRYENKWQGDIEGFIGEENIYYDGEKICFRNYLGGLVKNKK
jgi:hypothetical protein